MLETVLTRERDILTDTDVDKDLSKSMKAVESCLKLYEHWRSDGVPASNIAEVEE